MSLYIILECNMVRDHVGTYLCYHFCFKWYSVCVVFLLCGNGQLYLWVLMEEYDVGGSYEADFGCGQWGVQVHCPLSLVLLSVWYGPRKSRMLIG